MGFPPSEKSLAGLLGDHEQRVSLLERRLATGGTGGSGGGSVVAGLISPFGGGAIPTGWLLCDGAAVSRTDLAALFAAIGTAWGAGDGSTTFNLPNLKGRVPVGRDAAQTEFDVLGETGGAKTHTLTTPEIPSHAHNRRDIRTGATPTNPGSNIGSASGSVFYTNNGSGLTADSTGTDPAGGGGAHNNLQPYAVTNFIISTGTGAGGGGGGGGGWTPVPATETAAGIAEIATQAETTAGLDDQRIVTPLKLAQRIALLPPGGGSASVVTAGYGIDVAGNGAASTPYVVSQEVESPAQQWDFRMVGTNWSGPVGARLTVPTHISPAGGQATHPSVAFFPENWNGYRYWMAYTPYPGSNDDHEDPNLAVSIDGITWIHAPGVTQPLDDADGDPEYNSDTDLVLGPDGRLFLFWRFYDSSLGSFQEKVYMRTSLDGVTWTPKALVYQFTQTVRRPLSPSFVYEDGRWTVWAVDIHTAAAPVIVKMQNNGPDPTTGWGTMTDCTINAVPAGKAPWHLEVRRLGGQYVMILTVTDTGAGGVNGQIILATSGNGLSWAGGTQSVIPPFSSGEHDSLYRATFIPEFNDGQLALRVWYSAYVAATSIWNIYRTALKVNPPPSTGPYAQAAGNVAGPANVNPSTGSSVAVTFPAGRFSQPPIVTATTYTSTRLTLAITVLPTSAGVTFRLENWTTAIASGALGIYWTAVQMTASASPGVFEDSEPTRAIVVTCHTPGCDNAGIAIPLTVPLVLDGVVCGVCAQPILDLLSADGHSIGG